MAEKKAFVFDTNFIIQTKALDEVMANLVDRFSVYVTQVSVDERIAQECREVKARYCKLDELKEAYRSIARITILKSCDEVQEEYRTGMQKKYEEAFQERLIPFSRDGDMLAAILERANLKKAPFLSDDKASDKGFKDALIWESMLKYFKERGESEVLLITDDQGFLKNEASLCREFIEITGKTLSIHPNSYYRDLLKPELVKEDMPSQKIPNVEQLREKTQRIISDLCYIETEGYWGNPETEITFTTNQLLDDLFVQAVFDNLKQIIIAHLFETELPASVLFGGDNRITDTGYQIPMVAIENALNLFDEVREKQPEFVPQFFGAVATIFNRNYREPENNPYTEQTVDDEDELPF